MKASTRPQWMLLLLALLGTGNSFLLAQRRQGALGGAWTAPPLRCTVPTTDMVPPVDAAPQTAPAIPAEEEESWGESQVVKRGIAVASSLLATIFFFVQHNAAETTGVALLRKMEAESVPLGQALCDDKPTVIEFFAPWCESCKETAPSMRALELQYRDKVNFVAIDGSNADNAKLVSLFGVDGIPHLAFVTKDTEVKTALVGAVPKSIVQNNLDALLRAPQSPLPYEGYDAFSGDKILVPDKKSKCLNFN